VLPPQQGLPLPVGEQRRPCAPAGRHTGRPPTPRGGVWEARWRGAISTGVAREATRFRLFLGPLASGRVRCRPDAGCARRCAFSCTREGITSVHDFEGGGRAPGLARDDAWRRARASGVLMAHPRTGCSTTPSASASRAGPAMTGSGSGPLKLFADGTLGSQTAALLEPYEGSADRGAGN